MDEKINPQFPLYIVSKGRSEYMVTSRVLTELGVKHFIVIENQDYIPYIEAINKWSLLATPVILDLSFKENY